MHFLPFVDTIRGRWRNDVTRKRNDRTIRKLNASTWISWISKQIRDSVSHNSDFRCYLPSDPSEHVSFKVMFKLLNYARDSLVHVRPGKGEGSWIISPISLEAFSLSSFSLPFSFFTPTFFFFFTILTTRIAASFLKWNKQKRKKEKARKRRRETTKETRRKKKKLKERMNLKRLRKLLTLEQQRLGQFWLMHIPYIDSSPLLLSKSSYFFRMHLCYIYVLSLCQIIRTILFSK